MDPKLQALCTKYNIQATTDEEATAALSQLIDEIAAAIGAEEEGEPGAPNAPTPNGPPRAVAASHDRDPMVFKLAKQNRTLRINQLVTNGNISKATADKLIHTYASDENIACSLDETGDDVFEATMAALEANTPVQVRGSRLQKAVALSHDQAGDRRKQDEEVQNRLLGHVGQKKS